jgi:hypothetical protein
MAHRERAEIVSGEQTQPTHILAPGSIRKENARGLAAEYFAEAHRSHNRASRSLAFKFRRAGVLSILRWAFIQTHDCPSRQQWKRLSNLGGSRLRDVMTPHVQSALDSIHDERKKGSSHDRCMHIKVKASGVRRMLCSAPLFPVLGLWRHQPIQACEPPSLWSQFHSKTPVKAPSGKTLRPLTPARPFSAGTRVNLR